MTKKLIACLLLFCIFACLVSGCAKKITAQEAANLVIDSLDDGEQVSGAPHVHESTYGGKDCFNVFITVGEESFLYIVSNTGEILAHAPSEAHSH